MNTLPWKNRMRAGVLVTGLAVVFHILFLKFTSNNPNEKIHLPFGIWFNQVIGNEIKLNPRIKLISGQSLGSDSGEHNYLSVREWQVALNALAESPAQKILVAADFSEPQWKNLNLSKLGGKFVFASRVSQVHQDTQTLQTEQMKQRNDHRVELGKVTSKIGPSTDQVLIGPHESFGRKVGYGHLSAWAPFKTWPILRTDSPGEGEWSKHLALSGGASVTLNGNTMLSGERRVELNSDGSVYVLPVALASIESSVMSLQDLVSDPASFSKSFQGSDIVLVQERDLWQSSKGIHDELAFLAGLANQQLSNDWISTTSGFDLFIPLGIFTLVAAFLLSPMVFSLTIIPSLLLITALGPFLFTTIHLVIPWSQILFVLLPASLAGGAFGLYRSSLEAYVRRNQFVIGFGAKQADQIARKFETETFDTEEKLVTILDVDIVGFSKTIENTSPEETGKQISDFLSSVIDSVHSFGGFVSEVSPDGVLAVFGHNLFKEAKETGRDQVTQAILCAREIQTQSVAKIRDFSTHVLPPFPVRIAINTSTVRIGLIELKGKTDCKVIGAGVDLARQLATHCEPFRIMVSGSSYEFLKAEKGSQLEKWSTARAVKVAGAKEWLAAHEFDPFDHDTEQTKQATEIFRSYNKIKREDNRIAFPKGQEPLLQTDIGKFEILDFSLTGLRVRAQDFLSVGAEVLAWPAEFSKENAPFKAGLVVHWGVPDRKNKDVFVLGMRYTTQSESDLERIFEFFHAKVSRIDSNDETVRVSTVAKPKASAG